MHKTPLEKKLIFLLVAGSRTIRDREYVKQQILLFLKEEGLEPKDVFAIVEGGAPGVDRLAKSIAKELGIQPIEMEALWDYYGKPAGMIRNGKMSMILTHALLLCQDHSHGTENMLTLVQKRRDVRYKVVHINTNLENYNEPI